MINVCISLQNYVLIKRMKWLEKRFVHFAERDSKVRVGKMIRTSHHYWGLKQNSGEARVERRDWAHFTFTFMHLADAFIQSDLQCYSCYTFFCQYVCSLGIEPTTCALLMQCSNHWTTGTLDRYVEGAGRWWAEAPSCLRMETGLLSSTSTRNSEPFKSRM